MFHVKYFVAIMWFCATVAHAGPVLQFSPGSPYVVVAGATLSVDVEVTSLAGDLVSAYDLNVQYNPGLLTNPSVTFGTRLGNASIFEVLESDIGPDTASGLVDFAAVSLLSDADLLALQAPNATVLLATLSFDVLANGVASLNFTFGPTDDVKCSNATQCIPGTGVPEPGSIGLLLAALLGCGLTTCMTALRRRKLQGKTMFTDARKHLRCAVAAAFAVPFAAAGQTVVLTPNSFIGTVGFNQITPGSAVDTILTNHFGMNSANVSASSTNPLNTYIGSNSTSSSPQVAPTTGRPYTLSAEASGGGVSVPYNLKANASFGPTGITGVKFINFFQFTSPTPPALFLTKGVPPTIANFQECVGVVEVNFGSNNCMAPTTPINLGDPRIFLKGNPTDSVTRTFGQSSVARHIAKPAGTPQNFTLAYTTGSDAFSDLIQNEIQFQALVSCNVVAPVCLGSAELPGTGGGSGSGSGSGSNSGLGKIIGEWDVVGELENANSLRTLISAFNGPFGNYRYDNLGGEPGSPNPPIFPGPPRAFELENLLPGNYSVYGETTARLNRKYVYLRSDQISVTSIANQDTNLSDTFVMQPGFFFGNILLTHFPRTLLGIPSPIADSGLNDLYFSDTLNSNGVPNSVDLSFGSRLSMSSGAAVSHTAWPFDLATGDTSYSQTQPGVFRSNYNLPVVRANKVAGTWPNNGFANFELRFDNNGDGVVPNPPRPTGTLIISEKIAQLVLQPGAQRKVDFQYCFGSVNVTYKTATGTLYNPNAAVTGNFAGTLTALDRINANATLFTRNANYSVSSSNFKGIPQNFVNRASFGNLAMTLPLGDYTLTPTMNVDDGSLTTFTPIQFSLSQCDQHVDIEADNPPTSPPLRCDIDRDGDVDRLDIAIILNNRGKKATGINDPMDVNKDGVISINDSRACVLACTRPNCKTEFD